MKKVPKFLWAVLACIICIVGTAIACRIMGDNGNSSDKYLEILNIIQKNYYEETSLESVEDASAAAMLESLGNTNTFYIPADEYEEYKLAQTNQYIGIGISTQFNEKYGYLEVISVTVGSPADNAFIKVGNLVSAVNDIDVSTYTPEEFQNLLQSFDAKEKEEDKYFTLHLFNAQGGKAEVRLKCELIYAAPVVYYVLEDTSIGYIQLANFDDSAAATFKAAVESLKAMNVKSIIVDVRNNTSGKPAEVADALDYLLPKEDLFLLRGNDGKETTYSSGKSSIDIPIVLIVNENTTCGAEVFAYILQQNGCTVVGKKTSANAQSQTIIELEDGSAVRISKFEYLTLDKKSMTDLGGVIPNVVSSDFEDSLLDVQLEAAKDAAE